MSVCALFKDILLQIAPLNDVNPTKVCNNMEGND